MMTDAYFGFSAILIPVCLLSVLIDFKARNSAVWIILSGTGILMGFNLWLIDWIPSDLRRVILPSTILFPLFVLFRAIAKERGPRFMYTFIFCLSIAVGLVSLEPVVYALSHSLLVTAGVQIVLLSTILWLLARVYRPLYQVVQTKDLEDWLAYTLTPLLALVLYFLLEEDLLDPLARLKRPELKLLLLTILLVAHVLITLDFRKQAHLATLKDVNRLLETMLDQSRSELTEHLEKLRLIRLYRHDLHHHLSVLHLAAHAQNLDAFDAYVVSLKTRIDSTEIRQYCAHFEINALLSAYFKKANDHQILVTHRINLEETLPIDILDLAMILANAIENAIHALQEVDPIDRQLSVLISQDDDGLIIRIENPYRKEPVFEDGLPITTQPDHGHGTRGIRMLTQRYQGLVHFSVKKGRFIMIVQLPA